jgi:hypothetical protein
MRGDSERPTCACGSETFERVVVTRPEGRPYVTEFVACTHCRVMFHRPLMAPHRAHPEGPEADDWAAQYRKSVLKQQPK